MQIFSFSSSSLFLPSSCFPLAHRLFTNRSPCLPTTISIYILHRYLYATGSPRLRISLTQQFPCRRILDKSSNTTKRASYIVRLASMNIRNFSSVCIAHGTGWLAREMMIGTILELGFETYWLPVSFRGTTLRKRFGNVNENRFAFPESGTNIYLH